MSKDKKFEITPKVREELDALVRKATGKDAVERRLKSCLNPKWHRYEFWGTANGNAVNLNVEAKTAELMDEKCKTVKEWRRLQAREEKRAEAKLAREQRKAEVKKQRGLFACPRGRAFGSGLFSWDSPPELPSARLHLINSRTTCAAVCIPCPAGGAKSRTSITLS